MLDGAAPLQSAGHLRQFFIDGEWVRPSSDKTIKVVNPSTEEVFVEVAEAEESDVNAAVRAARAAFDYGPWPQISHAERAEYLFKIADAIRARSPELSDIWTSEVGALRSLGDLFNPHVGGVFDYYASLAASFKFIEQHQPSAGNIGLLVREPVGVVGAIIPWNGALNLAAWKIAPALLAGCTIILKSSPESPCSALVIAEVCEAAGLPPGVLNVLTADRDVSEALVRHPDVDKITFTGSSAAGKTIASICGSRVARCTLELGGKSAALILDDYDLATAAEALSQSARIMSGQVCSSLTRVIVSDDRHDQFVGALAGSFGSIKVGDPFDPAIDMGPLAMSRQRDRVEGYFAKARQEGVTIATGGGRPSHLNQGFFVEPTVFAGVDPASAIAQEEIFGPVISVLRARDERQAIDIANDSVFGLNASVFTNDPERAYRVARQLRSGTVGHNAWRTDFAIAFGGFKQSGIGREGGTEGLLPFLETKTIVLEELPAAL